MKTILWISLIFFFSTSLCHAVLMDVEIPHLSLEDSSPSSDIKEPGKIGFTANLETGETFNWFLIHQGQEVGSEGDGQFIWSIFSDPDPGAWVWRGRITFSNGRQLNLFESWITYFSADVSPIQSIANGGLFTFRTYYDFAGGAYESYEALPYQTRVYSVPEPATLSLLALGLAAIGIRRRLRYS